MTPNRSFGARLLASAALLLAIAQPVAAEEWALLGARYQAMGGAGVATVDDSFSTYWNPGALAFGDAVDVVIPIGVAASAEGGVLEDIDRASNFIEDNDLDAILDKIEAGQNLSGAELRDALELTIENLSEFGDRRQGFQGNAQLGIGGRYKQVALTGFSLTSFGIDPLFDLGQLSFAGAGNAESRIGAVVGAGNDRSGVLSNDGLSLAADIAGILSKFTDPALASPRAQELVFQAERAGIDTSSSDVRDLTRQVARATVRGNGDLSINDSGAFVRGLVSNEIGVSYAHPLFDKIGIGGTIKYIHGVTYLKYIQYDDIDDTKDLLDEATNRDNRTHDNQWGVDVGVLVKPVDWLRVGIVGRNLNEPSFDVDVPAGLSDRVAKKVSEKFTLERQIRAGAALDILPYWTIAVDADLTENSSDALDDFRSRLIGAGTELRLPVWKLGIALRGGVYANVADDQNNDPVITAGLGLKAWYLHLDVSGGISTDRTKVEATGSDDDIPSRFNLAGTLRFKKDF